MRSTDRARRWLARALGALLSLYLSVPAMAAFQPASSPLLSASAVTPNVMLLVDNSGSMDSVLMDTSYNDATNYPTAYLPQANRDCRGCSIYYTQGTALENTTSADYVFFSRFSQGSCSSGQYMLFRNASSSVCLTLNDPAGGGSTRYPINYVEFLVQRSAALNAVTPATSTRILTAVSVAQALINANRTLRMGLATFNPPTGSDPGPGGRIQQAIVDLSVTSNYNTLYNAIGSLSATSNTPLAETYYEVTRYFRGLKPFYNSSPATYTSPIQYRCQKNFGVVITDGLPTYDRDFPKSSSSDKDKDPNDPSYLLPNWDGINDDGNNLNGDGEGDTLYLDDIAKFAYDIDLRNSTAGTGSGKDLAGKEWDASDFPKQNLLTYTVGFTANNDMLKQAATYGHGKYYLATDNSSLATALSSALSDINSKAGSGGGGSTTSGTLSTSNYYYQTLYDPTDWRGVVQAFPFNTNGTVNTTTAAWSTNKNMAVGTSTNATYQSFNTAATTASGGVITYDYQNFSPAQQTTLNANLPTGQTGITLVAWSKGTNNSGLRTRQVLLGDVVNSPLVVASPSVQTAADLVGDTSYTSYLATKASSMNTNLLVNANDGFFNVINADNGSRRYGYMPSTALAGLYAVADVNYINGTSHKFLNDGQIGVFDGQWNSLWRTVAVAGTGGAGRAFYAVQLYDQNAGNVIKALWEIRAPASASTGNDYNDLGYAYAKAEVARMPDGTWAAFIANGPGSNSGVAALYVVNLATGDLIKKMVVSSAETDNGLASVKLAVNANNTVQAAYGGDLKGRLWKFDLSSTNTASWGLAFSGKPLFTAPGGTSQPITAQPLLVSNPNGGYNVFVGTGKFMEISDKTTTATQGFYSLWDGPSSAGGYTVDDLVAQQITGSFSGSAGQYMTTTQNAVDYSLKKGWYLPLTYNNTLVGERVIYQAAYTLGRIIFTTAGVDTSDPCASQGFGRLVELEALTGRMFTTAVIDTNGDGVINLSDTPSSGVVFSSGIPTLNAIVDVPSGGTSSTDSDGASTQRKVVQDSSGNITTLVEKGGGGSRRIMWRQVQ